MFFAADRGGRPPAPIPSTALAPARASLLCRVAARCSRQISAKPSLAA